MEEGIENNSATPRPRPIIAELPARPAPDPGGPHLRPAVGLDYLPPAMGKGVRGFDTAVPNALPPAESPSKSIAANAPRVAVLVDTSTGWGRRLIFGVMAYARKHGPWHLWIEPRGQHEQLRPPRGWEGSGIIARVSTSAMAKNLKVRGLPVVNVSGIQLPNAPAFPRVTIDIRAAGKLAAQHFLDRGFRNFAYVGMLRFAYVQEYARGFIDAIEAAGHSCHVFPASGKGWKEQQTQLGEWLKNLPKPLAVFAWGLRGIIVLEACHYAGLNVPGEVAVLAGDEDDLLCESTTPPLSGVETPSELVGHEAAATLDRLMKGAKPPAAPFLIPPTHVVMRQSSDTLAVEDPTVTAAVRFIRDNANRPEVDVPAILEQLKISRRSLERRFEQVFGRTPAEELRRVRLQTARQLLIETDLPIPTVAASSGFASPEYLNYVFKAELGHTPQKYRQLSRVR